jgi:hypothetical protein
VGVIKPTHVSQAAMDQAVLNHYAAWKTQYLRSTGGQGVWVKYDGTDSTVSEAHGWGMVLAAYMGDKAIFDEMHRYFRAHPSGIAAHLMAWKQTLTNGTMVNVEGDASATDGDMDIAYGLLLADAQWGSAGAIDYKAEALLVMRAILANEVNPTAWNLTPGDWAQWSDFDYTRPSDFMTGHLLAFARADTVNSARWLQVYGTVSSAVNHQFANGSQATGLMPDFMVRSGSHFIPVPGTYLEGMHDGDFHYNACRTPWRLAMSYIVEGLTDMLASQQRTATWIAGATGGVPNRIRAGYYITQGAHGSTYADYDDLPFTAPMAVNAMLGGPASQAWLNSLWTSITGGDYPATVDYYGDTIRMQVLMTVSGNWWAP